MEQKKFTCWFWGCKTVQPLWKRVWQFLPNLKLNIRYSHDPLITLRCIYPYELKTCPHQNLHTNVYSSFTHNCQNLEADKMFFSRWMDKLWYIHTMEYYSALKRNEVSSHGGNGNALYQVKETKAIFWKAIFCMIPTIEHFGKGKIVEKVRSVVSRDKGGMNRWSTEDFQSEPILCDTTRMDTGSHAVVKSHGMYKAKSEP